MWGNIAQAEQQLPATHLLVGVIAKGVDEWVGTAVLILTFVWMCLLVGWDVCFRRLPNWLTIPAWLVAPTACVVLDGVHAQERLLAGVVWVALYLAVGLLTGGVGGGDIKLAFPLGIIVGFPYLFAAVSGASVITLLSARPTHPVAHGPAMILAVVLCYYARSLCAGF